MSPLAIRYVAVIAAVGITVLVFIGAGRAIGDQHRTEERESVKGAAAAIAYRSAVAAATLEDIAVLFEASQDVTRTEFGRFASTALRRPAIRSIGWLPRVHGAAGRRRFERSRNLRLTTFGNGGRPRRSADRLERRIDDLLLVSRAKDGQVHADRSPTRVDAIAQDIVEAAMPQAARKSLGLVVDAPRCIANVDGNLLSQALDNLLSNAIKYTPDGGRVSVHVELVEDALEVRVADTGIGIAPELLDEVFEPFMRTPQAVEHGIRGTGLGLVTVKAVAEAHGGTTSVKSAPGRGTTFTLSLPAHAEAEPPASSAPSLASA